MCFHYFSLGEREGDERIVLFPRFVDVQQILFEWRRWVVGWVWEGGLGVLGERRGEGMGKVMGRCGKLRVSLLC